MQGEQNIWRLAEDLLCRAYGNNDMSGFMAHATVCTACAGKDKDKVCGWLDDLIEYATQIKERIQNDGKGNTDTRPEEGR